MSLLSACCDARPVGGMEEYGICGACKEHCEFWDDREVEMETENQGSRYVTTPVDYMYSPDEDGMWEVLS